MNIDIVRRIIIEFAIVLAVACLGLIGVTAGFGRARGGEPDAAAKAQALVADEFPTPAVMCFEPTLRDIEYPAAIDPNFEAQVNICLLPVSTAFGYDLRVTSGFRTVAEQDLIFRQGRTENGHVVTEVMGGRSLHNFGFAVDVADRWHGYRIDWERLGRIAAYCGLEQNEKGDEAHFEHRGGLSVEDFQVGLRPPTLILPCGLLAERFHAGESLSPQDLADCGIDGF